MNYDLLKRKISAMLKERNSNFSIMAEAIGTTKQGISGMFARESMNLNTLEDIAQYLKVPLWYLLQETTEPAPEQEDYKAKYYNILEKFANLQLAKFKGGSGGDLVAAFFKSITPQIPTHLA